MLHKMYLIHVTGAVATVLISISNTHTHRTNPRTPYTTCTAVATPPLPLFFSRLNSFTFLSVLPASLTVSLLPRKLTMPSLLWC